jgi:hypothetical protein
MARPIPVKKKLKNGFYIEVRNKGSRSGVIIGRDTKESMLRAAKIYEISKDVIILGGSEDGKWVNKAEAKKLNEVS